MTLAAEKCRLMMTRDSLGGRGMLVQPFLGFQIAGGAGA
jgi:hypothetical protein